MKGQKILKVTSILMIIGGIIAAILSVIGILGVSALVALAGSAEGTGLFYASFILAVVASIMSSSQALRESAPAAHRRKQRPVSNGALSLPC